VIVYVLSFVIVNWFFWFLVNLIGTERDRPFRQKIILSEYPSYSFGEVSPFSKIELNSWNIETDLPLSVFCLSRDPIANLFDALSFNILLEFLDNNPALFIVSFSVVLNSDYRLFIFRNHLGVHG